MQRGATATSPTATFAAQGVAVTMTSFVGATPLVTPSYALLASLSLVITLTYLVVPFTHA